LEWPFKVTALYVCYSDVLTDEAMLMVAWMVIPMSILITSIGSILVLSLKKVKLSDPYAKAVLIIGMPSCMH
jgi:oligosaccharide translocation protein RFT1